MYLLVTRLLFTAFFSFFLTLVLIPYFLELAKKFKIIDVPDGRIKTHTAPVPYLGGVAICAGFLISLFFICSCDDVMLKLSMGSIFFLCVGLVDDILCIMPHQKLLLQAIGASLFLGFGIYLKQIPFFLEKYWGVPISFLWILTIVNAFNLVDVMDGLATTLAGCATVSLLVAACLLQQIKLALFLACLLGALAAFLRYNFPPAKMYLGDAGALFIGATLATVPFLLAWPPGMTYGFAVSGIFFAIPLVEIVGLILIRSYKKIPFYNGSPHHFSIYLQRKGWAKAKILFCVACFSVILLWLFLLLFFNCKNQISPS